jgi:hypothetical protein
MTLELLTSIFRGHFRSLALAATGLRQLVSTGRR